MSLPTTPITAPEAVLGPPGGKLPKRPGPRRRVGIWLHGRRRVQLPAMLAAPLFWMVLVYLGALLVLLLNAFWAKDPFTGKVDPFNWSLAAFQTILKNPVYTTIALRTIGMAVLVTITDGLLALPIAYYMARIAAPTRRRLLVVAVLVPLWAAYLVKVYAWRIILQGNGLVDWALAPFGLKGPGLSEDLNTWVVLSYLWLPYMILPLYAGLERIPGSLLEASADLGAHSMTTFRKVVLPLVFPALVAGSIFTFSLTLGDYITPDLVSDAKFIGNVIYDNAANVNLPLAAAYSMIPISIMIGYLLIARRLGAFESL
jgi:putative spermidine/putrescine transport system permease protein